VSSDYCASESYSTNHHSHSPAVHSLHALLSPGSWQQDCSSTSHHLGKLTHLHALTSPYRLLSNRFLRLFSCKMTSSSSCERVLLAALLLVLVVKPHTAQAQANFGNFCNLTSAGGTLFNLSGIGELTSGILPRPIPGPNNSTYNVAYINLCGVAPSCRGSYSACLFNNVTEDVLPLCGIAGSGLATAGQFLFPQSPQAGALFACMKKGTFPAYYGVVASVETSPFYCHGSR
jgi:hypothetical protein